jgi:uncharacterized protein
MNKEEIRTTLQDLQPRIEQEFRAGVEGFFGSQARGNATESSDLDVLVRFGAKANLYDLIALGDFLESIFHCKVDIISSRSLSKEFAEQINSDLVRV